MTDSEVIRLRELRKTALRARAIAAAMNSSLTPNSVFSRSGQHCWQIARTITGRLRAHPNLSFQQGPSEARAAYDRFTGSLLSALAKYRGRRMRFYVEELRRVGRELDDARALTWSTDLSDDFGRIQGRVHRIITELEAAALSESGAHVENTIARSDGWRSDGSRQQMRAPKAACTAGTAEGNWPYLAI